MIKRHFVRFYGIHPKYLFIETNSFAIFKTNNYMINLEINISRSLRNFSIDHVVRAPSLAKDSFVFVASLSACHVTISAKMW